MTDEPAYCGHAKRSADVTRLFANPNPSKTRAEIDNVDWRSDLLEIARLVDRLAPDRHDPELFHMQKNALAHELRRLAHWARRTC